MGWIKQLIPKPKHIIFISKKIYPQCGREYCFCVKITDLKDKRIRKMYHDCYQMCYKYYTM